MIFPDIGLEDRHVCMGIYGSIVTVRKAFDRYATMTWSVSAASQMI